MFLFTTPPSTAPASRLAPATPVVEAIREGAERTGVDFSYLLATAKRESALDPRAQAHTSSASGLFQFIEQTWLGLIKAEGARAGVPDLARAVATRPDGTHAVEDPAARQAILNLRQDPEVASVMAGVLTQKNREALRGDLGREPSEAELYMAHFLGARGAADLIRAASRQPLRPAASDFPEAAAANRSIFYDREGRARGAGEVYALLARSHEPTSAAPAFAPDRPLAARMDGPALHSLFQSEGRRGPISDSVARIWRVNRTVTGEARVAALSYFPSSTGVAMPEESASSEESALPAAVPLPPPRPVEKPLDLSAFMRKP